MGADVAERGRHRAAVAFGVAIVLTFVWLLRVGVEQGFYLDEWDYLSARTAWDADDLLRPHNEHWSTLPILVYRAFYRVFGLASYVPYRALSVAAHLAAAAVMRLVLLRMGVGPWLATAVVLPWVLFGTGWENIVWGFQAAWSAALALSLAQLLLADHDGSRDAHDLGGLIAGLAGLMCAGIAVPVTATVGLCLLVRRGWRVAALHVVPLAVVYGLWSLRYGDTTVLEPAPGRDKVSFVWSALWTSVGSFSWWRGVGASIVVLVLVVVVALFRRADGDEHRQRLVLPVSFGVGTVGYLYVVASGRAFVGAEYASASRYQHVVMYLLLPLFGVAARAAIDWGRTVSPGARRATTTLVLLALWVGVPGNVATFSERTPDRLLYQGQLERVEAVAAVVRDRPDLPSEGQPLRAAPLVTIGWMREATRDGILAASSSDDPKVARAAAQALALVLVDEKAGSSCTALTSPVRRDMDPGDTVSFRGLSVVAEITGSAGTSTTTFDLTVGVTIQATEPLSVVLRPVHVGIRICD